MKLRFLSQICHQFHQQNSTIASEEILCYRGCKHNRPKPMAIDQPQTSYFPTSVVFCKYRGNFYVKHT